LAITVPNVLGKLDPVLGATFQATPSYCQVVFASTYVSPLVGFAGKFSAIVYYPYVVKLPITVQAAPVLINVKLTISI